MKEFANEFPNHIEREWNSGPDFFAQAQLFRFEHRRFATDEVKFAGRSAERADQLHDGNRVHRMSIHGLDSRVVQLIYIEFQQENGARLFATRNRVDQNDGVIGLEHRVSEVVTANPIVEGADSVRERLAHESLRHFTAESIVAKENVADSRNEDVHESRFCTGSTSSGP